MTRQRVSRVCATRANSFAASPSSMSGILNGTSTPRWHAGLEYRHHRGYEGRGFSAAKRTYAVNFIGPSVHYASRKWWITATFLKQLANAKAYSDEASADIIGGRFYGEHHERNELRVKVGFEF